MSHGPKSRHPAPSRSARPQPATLKNIAADGKEALADQAEQRAVLQEFMAYLGVSDWPDGGRWDDGGSGGRQRWRSGLNARQRAAFAALWRDLVGDLEVSLLRGERDALAEHQAAVEQTQLLHDRLNERRVEEADQVAVPSAAVLRWSSLLHRAAGDAERTNPRTLRNRRVAAAVSRGTRHLHNRIPAADEGLAEQQERIRRYKIRDVIRRVYSHVEDAITRREAKELGPASRRADFEEPREERDARRRLISERANALTARLVRAFFPLWGRHVDPPLVSEIVRDDRRKAR
jgi:hypothetical protein